MTDTARLDWIERNAAQVMVLHVAESTIGSRDTVSFSVRALRQPDWTDEYPLLRDAIDAAVEMSNT